MKRGITNLVAGLALVGTLGGCGETVENQPLVTKETRNAGKLPEHIRQQFYKILELTTSGKGASDIMSGEAISNLNYGLNEGLEEVLKERLLIRDEVSGLTNQTFKEPKHYNYNGTDILNMTMLGNIDAKVATANDAFNDSNQVIASGAAYELRPDQITESGFEITDISIEYDEAKKPDYLWYLIGEKGESGENFRGAFITHANSAVSLSGSFEYITHQDQTYCYVLIYGEQVRDLDGKECTDLINKINNSFDFGFGHPPN